MLGIRIIRAAPKDLTAPEHQALEHVRGSAEALQIAVGQRHGSSSASLRPLDRRFDGSWAALHGRVQAATRLVGEPEAERAGDLLASLFPDGLKFLTTSYEAEWFHSKMLLDRIMREDLYDDLVELAGQRYMDVVQAAHAALGQGLGLGEDAEAEDDEQPARVGELVSGLAEAIADYARVLAGTVDKKDPASQARFLAAMAPLDSYRAKKAASSSASEGEVGAEPLADVEQETDDEGLDLDSELPPVPSQADDEG